MAIVSTIASSPSVLPVSRRQSRGGGAAAPSRSSGSSSAAAAPAAAAAAAGASIADVFTVGGAVALLEATEPGLLREICSHLRLPATAAAAVAPCVAEALQCLVEEGVVCAMPTAGKGAPALFSVLTARHVIAPATVEVLRARGAEWDGMAMEDEGGGGGGGALPPPALSEVELVKELRQRLQLRSAPIAVLRAAWRGMEEDAVLLRPSAHTFALPKP